MYEYQAKLKKVVDGDTVDCYVDMGFDVHKSVRVRLNGIDCPESRTRDLTEKRYGLGAKHRLVELLEAYENDFIVKSHGVGKYGRCLGELFLPFGSVNDLLIEEGHAIKYTGGSKADLKEELIKARTKSKKYVEKHIKPLD
tara:strand:+ start:698 stop:1120 length:423 start_codon:yes stop_codon:yes gene_type:complete